MPPPSTASQIASESYVHVPRTMSPLSMPTSKGALWTRPTSARNPIVIGTALEVVDASSETTVNALSAAEPIRMTLSPK